MPFIYLSQNYVFILLISLKKYILYIQTHLVYYNLNYSARQNAKVLLSLYNSYKIKPFTACVASECVWCRRSEFVVALVSKKVKLNN